MISKFTKAIKDIFQKIHSNRLVEVFVLCLGMMIFCGGEVQGQCNNTLFYTSSTNTPNPWTVPAGVTSISIEAWGGGGGGAGSFDFWK